MLMLICGLAVSANAVTYQLADYLEDPTFDQVIDASNNWNDHPWGSGAWEIPAPTELMIQHPADWEPDGPNQPWPDNMVFYADMQEEAYSGTQAVAIVGNVDYNFGWVGIVTEPDAVLHTGDVWEFDLATRLFDNASQWTSGDVVVGFYFMGYGFDSVTIPAASITTEWAEQHFSLEYTGAVDGLAAGDWTIRIYMTTPEPSSEWHGVFIDMPVPDVPELLEGDANRDGVVSAGDYASVQSNFGHTGESGIPGDANCDGVVSAGDYASVQANFGAVLGSGTVPEPMTMSLLALGGVALLKRK